MNINSELFFLMAEETAQMGVMSTVGGKLDIFVNDERVVNEILEILKGKNILSEFDGLLDFANPEVKKELHKINGVKTEYVYTILFSGVGVGGEFISNIAYMFVAATKNNKANLDFVENSDFVIKFDYIESSPNIAFGHIGIGKDLMIAHKKGKKLPKPEKIWKANYRHINEKKYSLENLILEGFFESLVAFDERVDVSLKEELEQPSEFTGQAYICFGKDEGELLSSLKKYKSYIEKLYKTPLLDLYKNASKVYKNKELETCFVEASK